MSSSSAQDVIKVVLPEDALPTHWYNIAADLPEPPPPYLHPGTGEPLGPHDLDAIFPQALVAQEMSAERWVEIPAPVRDVYRRWRPTPLLRARALEAALGTPARIYVKYEGTSPAGSHKVNTSVPQAYYNSLEGVRRLTTETGAGQWGTALAFACQQFGMECEVWQVRASYDSKPYRRTHMETLGAVVHPSPSELTESGRRILADHPTTPGSLGMAISEATEVAFGSADTHYSLGSVLNHVLLHQTVIGQEALAALDLIGEEADEVFGCAGGGSNLGGLAMPFLQRRLAGTSTVRVTAAEPAACPSITKGEYRYDSGDVAGLTPLMKMHTLGHDFVPDPIHAGGLRYHGMSPMVSHCVELGLIDAVAKEQDECFAAGLLFARTEGIVPAPESTHAIAAALDAARACTETGEAKVLVIGLSGHGLLDLPAYADYLSHGGQPATG